MEKPERIYSVERAIRGNTATTIFVSNRSALVPFAANQFVLYI
jgi:hypothetical protein